MEGVFSCRRRNGPRCVASLEHTNSPLPRHVIQSIRLQGACVCVCVCVCLWHDCCIFRRSYLLLSQNKLTALSQHDQTCFTPNIARFKSTIEKKIKMVFTDSVQGPLEDYQNYTVDFFVSPNKVCMSMAAPSWSQFLVWLFSAGLEWD